MSNFLPSAQIALTIVILIWDVVLAGRIAQNRQAPRLFQAISGLAALLVLPGLLLTVATSTLITGRAVAEMDWVWPAVLVLFAFQAIYALARGLVSFAWGIPIAAYDIVLAAIGVIRYMVAHGHTPPEPLVALMASQSLVMVLVTLSPNVLASPFFLNMPMVSPAFPALNKPTATFRLVMSLLALIWVVFIFLLGLPRAVVQLRNYEAHRHDQLRERPDADFAIGLKILPDLYALPLPAAIHNDSALVDTMDVDAVAVVIDPGAPRASIDSLARVLDYERTDSTLLIAVIGYRGTLIPGLRRAKLNAPVRLATLREVVEKLQPDIVLPAEDPYGAGERALGTLSPRTWENYLTDAAHLAKSIDSNVKVGVSASSYRTDDSTLYAWAESPRSPIDLVGFSFFPSPYVGGGISTDTRTADRWMRVTPPVKEHWVFATGGYPLAYGERSQELGVWQVMAWATDHPIIKGLVVYEAGDYGQSRGLRAPNGRLRSVTGAVMRAIRGLRESAR